MHDLIEVERVFSKLIRTSCCDLELYFREEHEIRWSWENGREAYSEGEQAGIGVWVRVGERWGYAFCSSLSEIENAVKRAKSAGKRWGSKRFCDDASFAALDKNRVAQGFEALDVFRQGLSDAKKGLKSLAFSLSGVHSIRVIMNSFGAVKMEMVTKFYASANAVAKENGREEERRTRWAGLSAVNERGVVKCFEEAKEGAIALLKSRRFSQASLPVILDPQMTGVFVHEVLGHAAEHDAIEEGDSVLRGKLGEQLSERPITVVDNPLALDFGHYRFDDEGFPAREAFILREGVFRETLRSSSFGSNGHARAQSLDAKPIVRMSNTYMLPGKDSVEDVFDVREGIYLAGCRGGNVDTLKGEFLFTAAQAWLIRRGEQVAILKDVSISGNLLEALRGIELVSRDFDTSPGFCGKNGQYVPVSDGGPHVRLRAEAVRVS